MNWYDEERGYEPGRGFDGFVLTWGPSLLVAAFFVAVASGC